MRALAIARASGRRVLRDRVSVFFLIVLPIVVIVIVGAVAQGFNTFRVGVVNLDGAPASRQLVAELVTPRDWRSSRIPTSARSKGRWDVRR